MVTKELLLFQALKLELYQVILQSIKIIFFILDISRKDDLFNLLYMLIYVATGHLPWFEFIKKNETRMGRLEFVKSINDYKIKCSDELLCEGLPGKPFFYI
jgi:hypothetical protein